eukprot:g2455.t1
MRVLIFNSRSAALLYHGGFAATSRAGHKDHPMSTAAVLFGLRTYATAVSDGVQLRSFVIENDGVYFSSGNDLTVAVCMRPASGALCGLSVARRVLRAVAHGVKRKRVRRAVKEEVDEILRQIVGGTDAQVDVVEGMNAAEVRPASPPKAARKEGNSQRSSSTFITRLSRIRRKKKTEKKDKEGGGGEEDVVKKKIVTKKIEDCVTLRLILPYNHSEEILGHPKLCTALATLVSFLKNV